MSTSPEIVDDLVEQVSTLVDNLEAMESKLSEKSAAITTAEEKVRDLESKLKEAAGREKVLLVKVANFETTAKKALADMQEAGMYDNGLKVATFLEKDPAILLEKLAEFCVKQAKSIPETGRPFKRASVTSQHRPADPDGVYGFLRK